MGLDQADRAAIAKAVSVGTSDLAVPLSGEAAAFLAGIAARDLGRLHEFPEFSDSLQSFFEVEPPDSMSLRGVDYMSVLDRLSDMDRDAVMYFGCLAHLQKARLKYAQIEKHQPMPTIEQVGPRGLLQYGRMSSKALTGLLLWRKFFYDLDNRAGQETGYLFEPIIASCVGGAPAPARKSPVKRHDQPTKGRQIDCVREKTAYEFKIRVTIAASGQGRWKEEMDFPLDCRTSDFVPALVVFDGTPNPKLEELKAAFERQGGNAYIGEHAWRHLEELAGTTMSKFLQLYVRQPIDDLLSNTPAEGEMPDIQLRMDGRSLLVSIGGDEFSVQREPRGENETGSDELPEGADEIVPGP